MTTGAAARRQRRDEADPDADQAAAVGRHRDQASRPRRCASEPTRASCRRRASSARRCWRSCSPTRTGESSAATTSTTCWQPSAPTGTASDGHRPDRLHGRRQVDGRPRARRRRCRRPGRAAAGRADRGVLRARGRGRHSASIEEDVVLELLGNRRDVDRARRRSARAPSASAQALADHVVAWLEVDVDTAWNRVVDGRRSSARPRPRHLRRALRRARAALRWPSPTRSSAPRRRSTPRRSHRCARCVAASGCCGRRCIRSGSSGDTTSAPGRLRRLRRARRAAARAGRLRDRRRRRAQDAGGRRAGVARDGPARHHAVADASSPSAAASSATSPASAPPPTSAASPSCRSRRRSSPRSTRPTAARPASICRRRRTTSAPTTSRRPSMSLHETLATLPAAERAAGYAEVVKTALIAGGELWRARSRRRRRRRRRGDGVRTDEACDRRRRRARRRTAPGSQPRPHHRPRDRDGDRLRLLPPRRGGRARAAGGAAAFGARRPARGGRRAARRRRACRLRCDDVDPDAVVAATHRDKKRIGSDGPPYVLVAAARRGYATATPSMSRASVPRSTSCWLAKGRRREHPHRDHARRQPRPARAPAGGALRHDQLRRARAPDRRLRARARPRHALLPDATPRASSSTTSIASSELADAIIINPGAWTHYALGDPRRARDRGAAGGRGSPFRRRRIASSGGRRR